ncbi:hypothetical protein LZ31DRAFT_238991 [Colletotrichum somersetense]|nr:hypothetical protein LZ31DRAFT_238991 [Colletotrichum somersetense]
MGGGGGRLLLASLFPHERVLLFHTPPLTPHQHAWYLDPRPCQGCLPTQNQPRNIALAKSLAKPPVALRQPSRARQIASIWPVLMAKVRMYPKVGCVADSRLPRQ